jgi:thymidylate kinase
VRAHEVVDAAARDRVLVFGSLPPHGRDLDVLARPSEHTAVASALATSGFDHHRDEWARFRPGVKPEVVELVPASDWRLPSEELDALFADAILLDDARALCRPAPHHALLIAARRAAREPGPLTQKLRDRIAQAVAEDARAWDAAERHASAWDATHELAALRRRVDGQEATTSPRPSTARRARNALSARRRSAVVSLSGLDGSGKSSQAAVLVEALQHLGHDGVIAWTRITHNPSLDVVAGPVKRLLRTATRASVPADETSPDVADDPGKRLRQRSALVTHAWVTVVAFANAWSHRRLTARHLRRGRIVVCDRYVLDSAAHLRAHYGSHRRFRFQVGLIRLLSPAPLASFLLDVPPSVSMARKPGEWSMADRVAQHDMYLAEYERFRALHLDGCRDPDELAAEIARVVWRRL